MLNEIEFVVHLWLQSASFFQPVVLVRNDPCCRPCKCSPPHGGRVLHMLAERTYLGSCENFHNSGLRVGTICDYLKHASETLLMVESSEITWLTEYADKDRAASTPNIWVCDCI